MHDDQDGTGTPGQAPGIAGDDAAALERLRALSADTAGQSQLARMAETLTVLGALAPGAIAMLRAERGIAVALPWPGFTLADERSYGTTTLYLMEKSA